MDLHWTPAPMSTRRKHPDRWHLRAGLNDAVVADLVRHPKKWSCDMWLPDCPSPKKTYGDLEEMKTLTEDGVQAWFASCNTHRPASDAIDDEDGDTAFLEEIEEPGDGG